MHSGTTLSGKSTAPSLEETLRQSEQRFAVFMHHLPGFAWMKDLEGRYVFANYMLAQLEPYRAGWRGKTDADLWPAEIAATFRANDQTVIATRKPLHTVEPYLRNGEARHALVSKFPILSSSGAVEMVGGASIDITERKQAEEALHRANRHLQIISRRRVQVQEDERRHLARELHDQIGQALTATKICLRSAKRSRKREAIARQLDYAVVIVDGILRLVQQMTLHLRPSVLDDLGLVPALRLILDDHAKRAGWHPAFSGNANLKRPSAEVETACFRIALEALTNILRHAKARNVSLELEKTGDSLHLIVRDDGIGFDVADAEKRIQLDRLGLVGMRERATAVGGKFECKSVPGQGTEVHAFLPFQAV